MLENVVPASLSKERAKELLPALQDRLHQLQRAAYEGKVGTLIVFEGWRLAGKSSVIKKLTERLEPRAFTLHSIRAPRTSESQLPWMWRFWSKLPSFGEMALFHRSWYGELVDLQVQGELDASDWLRRCRDIRFFEDTLARDRYVVIKLFLHIDAEEQKKRLEAMAEKSSAWELTDADWLQNERYDRRLEAIEEMLQQTEAEWGPWSLINATHRRWARVRAFEVLIRRLEEGLAAHGVSTEVAS